MSTDLSMILKDAAQKPKIVIIGFGEMGGALGRGLMAADPLTDLTIIGHKNRPNEFLAQYPHVEYTDVQQELSKEINQADIIIIAVKPKDEIIFPVLKELCKHASPDTTILSVAAGAPIDLYEHFLGKRQPVIRAMSNTPATIGRGVTVVTANKNVTPEKMRISKTILKAAGHVREVDNEKYMDAVTGVSGSGPAYFFYAEECLQEISGEKYRDMVMVQLQKALSKASVAAGLPPGLAGPLAADTHAGSLAYAAQSDKSSTQLREKVTSPNGTTKAGLTVLMDEKIGLKPLLQKMIEENYNAEELAKELEPLIARTVAAATGRGTEMGDELLAKAGIKKSANKPDATEEINLQQ
jgi:pyrroline-5-carboxylate reductase